MESVAISDFDCNTLSQYSALGFIASIACVLATFCIRSDTFCFCSVFRAVSKRIILSGFRITCSIVSNVIYAPCLRMDGNTSDVTHLRNGFALSESLRITTSYNPLSVTNVACCPFLNPKSNLAFKSSSNRLATAVGLDNPITPHTSAKQNKGSPLAVITVLTCPKLSLLKILISFIILWFLIVFIIIK
ncbi:hypothetical protein M139_3813 [Bacteroides fragilis str. S23L24]|nr:hypothetical protein M139_3813 [Bacteroides fragilis str. S23L24]EYE42295.1 hypothetical protein M138_3753 [Bacteroides fragilis str. S23L17]